MEGYRTELISENLVYWSKKIQTNNQYKSLNILFVLHFEHIKKKYIYCLTILMIFCKNIEKKALL